MNVELLRTGTVPISPETILWFEFLLDPDLLLKHLQKPDADPTPLELIKKFYDVIAETLRIRPESENVDNTNLEFNNKKKTHPAKNIALKILSLKVAAFLKWDLEQLRNLPFKTQANLVQDLMYFTNSKKVVKITNVVVEDLKTATPQYLFALLLCYRWVIYTSMHKVTTNWHMRSGINDIPPIDIGVMRIDNLKKVTWFLSTCLSWDTIPNVLTFDCFKLPTETNDCIEFDWEKSQPISKREFDVQIHYDLGMFFFYQEEYEEAKEHFYQCYLSFQKPAVNSFYTIDRHMVEAYGNSIVGLRKTLLDELNISRVHQYMGLISILQQDNIIREIPLVHRLNLELDIQGALCSGAFTVARDLLHKVKALNIVRCVLDKKPLYQYSISQFNNLNLFVEAFSATWESFSEYDKQLLKSYLLQLVISGDFPELMQLFQSRKLYPFDKHDLYYIENSKPRFPLPCCSNKTQLNVMYFSRKRKPKIELRQLERRLIYTYECKEIKEILVNIAMIDSSTSVWNINPQWELPIPLQSVLKSMPRGFHQDFAYVILAKSREQLLNKNWNLSLEFLLILDQELRVSNCNATKLFKLISWEILLLQITQMIDEWPKNTIDQQVLAKSCEICLQTNDSVLPRTEIVEQCAVCLLNLGRWDFLINLDKKWSTFEITSAIACAVQDITKPSASNKKPSKNLWDIVLPVFATSASQSKRGSSGYHDMSSMKSNLLSVFFKLKHPYCLTVIITILCRIFNILKDDPSLELHMSNINLWPTVISNANSYDSAAVYEVLSEIVTQALKHSPTDLGFLRLMGDINFANGHYKISLSYYLKFLVINSDYFNIPLRNNDDVFRRMIKCCTSLGCHTQAAVLCQFLEETDYSLAFRILADQKTSNDAVDAYYHCFWDTSILEYLIHMHNKKGEFQRRKCAVQVIGMLELNSNNNEEIQREASNLRKSTFLRALCKQYVV